MSVVGKVFNRIKNIFSRNKVKALGAGSDGIIQKNILNENIVQTNIETQEDLMWANLLNTTDINFFNNPNNYNEYCQAFFSDYRNFASQYDYATIVTEMQRNGTFEEFKTYLQYIQTNQSLYYPSKVHGIEHTSRVLFNAEMLCMLDNIPPREKHLILVAAQLHDIGREDDGKNFDHGSASCYKIDQFGLLRNFSERDRDIIKFAVAAHSLEPEQIKAQLEKIPPKIRGDYKIVLDYLQDADKLDRTRIANKGWGLDPNRLASQTAKQLVKVAHQNYYGFEKVMCNYEKMEFKDNHGNKMMSSYKEIKEKGYNISYDDFLNIVSEYQPNVLELLRQQDRIEDIFDYETFKQFRKTESFEDKLKPDRINPDLLYDELNQNSATPVLKSSFNKNFMLYYNLKKNYPESFSLLCSQNLDIDNKKIAGVIHEIKFSDLEQLYSKRAYFRISDLILLASKVTPEEYRNIIDTGRIEDLYSSKYEKDSNRKQIIIEILKTAGVKIHPGTFEKNYRLIEHIVLSDVNLLKEPGISQYTIPEIFAVFTKLQEASDRIKEGKVSNFDYSNKTVLDLLEYNKSTGILFKASSEKEQLDIAELFTTQRELVQDPRYIEYLVKPNKPFVANKPLDIINYKKFCSEQILLDNGIDLDNAKSKLLNSIFDIQVIVKNQSQQQSYQNHFENEVKETLYYCRKYKEVNNGKDTNEGKKDEDIIGKIIEILEKSTIQDFKDDLYKYKDVLDNYNTQAIYTDMRSKLINFSKSDIANKLQQTQKDIEKMPTEIVIANNGMPVEVKVLRGQEFNLAISTSMPKCSGVTSRIRRENGEKAEADILNQMLSREMEKEGVCTSIISNKMLAHAQAANDEQELIFGYVLEGDKDISLMGKYDLSTTKDNNGKRITQKAITPRSIKDFVEGTTEEHNEVVMNQYPKYIISFDKVSEVAYIKQKELQEEYKRKGININVEILVIDSEKTYIPQIKGKIEEEHEDIKNKLNNGQFTSKDFENMFEKHESNFVLRTLQAIHSTSFRDDLWDDNYNKNLLDSLTEILDNISKRVPPEKSKALLTHIDTLLKRADSKDDLYGNRFYDHVYRDEIDVYALENIKSRLIEKVIPYERGLENVDDEVPTFSENDFEEQSY